MVYTNASSVPAAAPPAPPTGGMETSTLDLLSSCRPTGGSSTQGQGTPLTFLMELCLNRNSGPFAAKLFGLGSYDNTLGVVYC